MNNQFQLLPRKIVVLKDERKFLLNLDHILYFYYEDNGVKIMTVDNSTYCVNHSLDFWEKRLLNDNFIRCQKGYLVNIEKVIEIVPYFNSTLALRFKEHKTLIPVGRKFAKYFKYIISW